MTSAFWLFYKLDLVTNKYTAYTGFIAFYIAMEFLHQSWDLSFPWMTLGNGLAGMHQLAQWYEYTGVYGGSCWILLSNILAYEAYASFRAGNSSRRFRPAVLWLVVLLAPSIYSINCYSQYKERETPVNVVTVQPNIDPYDKFGSMSAMTQLGILIKLSDSIAQPNTEYFLWPETAIPQQINEDDIRNSTSYTTAQSFLSKYKTEH